MIETYVLGNGQSLFTQMSGRVLTGVVLASVLAMAAPVLGQTGIVRFGTLGDSLTDEYFEQDYGGYARCWAQLLVEERSVPMGPTAVAAGVTYWGEPRRSGYEDNWARYSGTTETTIVSGAHFGLRNSVGIRGTSHAVLFIGGNDFSPWAGPYNALYMGDWFAADIQAYIESRLVNYRAMLDVLQQTGVKIVLANVLDFSFMPFVSGGHSVGFARDRVNNVITQFNTSLRELADERDLVYVDIHALTKDLFGTNTNPRSTILVGNTSINLLGAGVGANNAFVVDAAHPHTVIQGIWANLFITALSDCCDAAVLPFSESEIVSNAGLVYGGQETLGQYIAPYRLYISDFTCRADINADQVVSVQDIFDFLSMYFASQIAADFNQSGEISVQDIFDFLTGYFAGCD